MISQIDFSLSDSCNLRCRWCYVHGGHGNSYNQQHIDKSFDWIFSQYEAKANEEQKKWGITITIYGGEPLFEWEHLKDVVVSKKAEAKQRGYPLKFSLVTNMTLLDEEKLNWLMDNHVGIHPSIDGNAQAEDACRIDKDGNTYSAIVFENARRLLARLPNRSCRMTVSPQTVSYLFDSIKFLTKEIGFKTVNAVMAGGVNWTDDLLEIHKQQIELVTNWWIDEMRNGNHYSLYHLRNMFLGIWSGRRIRSLCSSGISHVAIDTLGSIWPCHRFSSFQSKPEYLLGTIDTGVTNLSLVETLRNYDIAEANKERCKDCPAVNGCHALCLHEMMIAGKGMFEPLEHYCKVWPFYMKMALRAHSVLMAENNQLYINEYDPQVKRQKEMETNRKRNEARQKNRINPNPKPVPKPNFIQSYSSSCDGKNKQCQGCSENPKIASVVAGAVASAVGENPFVNTYLDK